MIFVLRHLPTVANELGILGEHSLSRISSQGLAQAPHLQEFFRCRPLDLIFSSDLERCIQTARSIRRDPYCPILSSEAARELNFGDWAGLPKTTYEARAEWEQRKRDLLNYRPPGGENYLDLETRLSPLVNQAVLVLARTYTIAFVGHKALNRVLLSLLLGLDHDTMFRIDQPNALIYEINLCNNEVHWHDYITGIAGSGLVLSDTAIA